MVVTRKIRCRVDSIIDHGEHVYTVNMIPESHIPRFNSGQFLHLALDEYDPSSFWPESRVFSIANSPSDRGKIQVCYSVVGKFTTRMEIELDVGKMVWIKLPYGDFIIKGERDIVLFAGGTGISAFISFLRNLKPDFPHEVYLFFGTRNCNLLLYFDVFQSLATQVTQFHVLYFVEHGNVIDAEFINGRLSIDNSWSYIRKPLNKNYYLSGPPVMLKLLSACLILKGVETNAVQIDAWE